MKSYAIKVISKYQLATAIAILFHAIGFVGMLLFNRGLFVQATPLHLLLMCGLLVWTQQQRNKPFFLFVLIAFVAGFAAEIIGTSTGLLFGNYVYGQTLGYSYRSVPLMIGLNWFMIIYCCGVCVEMLMAYISNKLAVENPVINKRLQTVSVIVDGAMLAVILDVFLEPAAIKLGYWHWLGNGIVPWFNYACWFGLSALLLIAFRFLPFAKENKFAVNLLLIQVMFFLLVRTFL